MSRQTTLRDYTANDVPLRAALAARERGLDDGIALARAFVAVQLLAVAAIGAALADHAATAILVAWSSFTLLNAVLLWCGRSGLVVGNAAAGSALFDTALAAVLGLAWGGSVALLASGAPPLAFAVVVGAGFAVSLTAIPVFGRHRVAQVYFVATQAALAAAGVMHDGRFPWVTLWVVFGAATELVIASVWYRGHARLRTALRHLLRVGEPALPESAYARVDDDDLVDRAARHADTLAAALATAARDRRLLGALGDAVVAVDDNGRASYLNPLAEVLTGWRLDELDGQPLDNVLRLCFPPDTRNQAREIFDQVRRARRPQHGADNARLTRRDGVIYGIDYVVTPLKDDRGEFLGAVYVLRDVTEKRNRAESIAWQATHDPLTGTINRAEFELRLKKLVRRTQGDDDHVHSLLYIDVDRFKQVNDNYGHAAGDAVLKALSAALRMRIRGADTLARVGGDEFAALLYSCGRDKARLIAEGLRLAIEKEEIEWQGIALHLSLSIGIVEINHECRSIAEIVRAADTACYAAKKFGRNRVQLFDQSAAPTAKNARVFDFVKDIQTAIHGNRLELLHRPLLATTAPRSGDDMLKACELGVGIRNAAGELLSRTELLDLAVRYQLIEDIDRWAIKAAFDALHLGHPALRDMDLVLVPLSQPSLGDERLLDYVLGLVSDMPGVAARIGFSFDEAGLVGHLEYVRYFVTALKQHGCRFMIGDLGFGAEGIDIVKSLQADFLGIRGRLVQDLLHSSVDYEVVLGLSRIARALGMRTVAAGADTRTVHEALGKMGIDYTLGAPGEAPRQVSIPSEAQWV